MRKLRRKVKLGLHASNSHEVLAPDELLHHRYYFEYPSWPHQATLSKIIMLKA